MHGFPQVGRIVEVLFRLCQKAQAGLEWALLPALPLLRGQSGRELVEALMRAMLVALTLVFASMAAHAEEGSCTVRAAEKKLAGAAKTSFMKKCESDAKTACEAAATEKKLAGAARNSFVGKCVKDAVGG